MTITQSQSISSSSAFVDKGVPSAVVVGWLFIFVVFEWLRTKFGPLGFHGGLSNFTQKISILECGELFLLFRMLKWRETQDRISATESALILCGIACVVIYSEKPFVTASLLSIFLMIRFGLHAEYRMIVIGVFVFIMQFNPIIGQLGMSPSSRVADMDALLLRSSLTLVGYNVTGGGSIVYNPAQEFGIDILSGCASLGPLMNVLAGFIIIVIGSRGHFVKTDLVYLGGLVVATVCANLLRLAPAALSGEGYQYWHSGDGAAIIAAVYAVLAFSAGYCATRRATWA